MKYHQKLIQKAKSFGGWALAIFYYLRPDRSTDIAVCRFSLFIRPAMLSHARTQEISTADPRRDCLFFSYFFFPFLFSSHRQPTNVVVVGVTLSFVCV
jgi:hypothetical protein